MKVSQNLSRKTNSTFKQLLLDVCGNNLRIFIKLRFKVQIYKVSHILTHLILKISQILSLIRNLLNY